MEAWSREFTSASSPSSSSASPSPPLLFDVADELWFYGSVVSFPSLSLPCLPALFSPPPPDPSTLIAQCMITHLSPPPLSSSSSSPTPPPDSQPPETRLSPWDLPAYHACPAPPASDEDETAYGGYSSSSDSDKDEEWGYPRANAGEDEEAYHYYTAPSDCDDEEAYHGHHVPSDSEDEQQVQVTKEEMLPSEALNLRVDLERDDALSGIYDVGVLLKDQHQKRTREVPYSRFQRDTALLVAAISQIPVSSRNDEQKDMKENLKLWAHAVASTLAWKAAAQARPLL